MIRLGTYFLAGLLFALGLVIGGMTQPQKVLGFLDVFGDWDPSLLFVMLGAVGIHSLSYRIIMRRASPLLANDFRIPKRQDIDARLLGGAALFGIGWGLAGYCPGPVLVASGAFVPQAFILLMSMLVGFYLCGRYQSWSEERRSRDIRRVESKAPQGV